MTPAATLPPLTHHEILALVEPFVRAGHRPDLARSGVEDACTCVQDVSDEMLQACARWCAGLRAHLLS